MSDQTLAEQADSLIGLVKGLGASVELSNEAIAESNQQIAESNKRIGELGTSGKRNRRLIHALAVSLIFDILLSVILGLVGVNASTASDKATVASRQAAVASAVNKANAVNLCKTTNESRAAAKSIWVHVLGLNKPTTAAAQKTIDDVLNLVNKTYQPRVC